MTHFIFWKSERRLGGNGLNKFALIIFTITSIAIVGFISSQHVAAQTEDTESVVLHPNKDSFLREQSINTNEGANTQLDVRNFNEQIKRTILAFDQDSIKNAAANKILQSAKLRLYIVDNNDQWGNGRDVNVHKLLQDWKEGNGFNAQPWEMSDSDFALVEFRGDGQGVTWNCAVDNDIENGIQDCENSWNGGNFEPQKTDSIIMTNGLAGWVEFDVTSDVQGFLDGKDKNFGWIVKKADETQPGLVHFASREAETNNPQLVLTFSTDSFQTQSTSGDGKGNDDSSRIPPPSLSGSDLFQIPDGFTVGGDSYSVTGNLMDLPTHRLVINAPQTIIVKTYCDSALGYTVTHISLNIGPHPMSNIGQAIISFTWDESSGLQVNDPQSYVSNVSVNKQKQGNLDVFTFTFTPLKDLPTSDVIIRTWNNKFSSTDYTMTDAIKFTGEFLSPSLPQLPDSLKVYDNISDLQKQLDSDGYTRPHILSHIHDTSAVFGGSPGKINWFYDTKENTVALVLEDGNGKIVNLQLEKLVSQDPIAQSANFMVGNISYSSHSLSRDNVNEIENAKSIEQLKALNMLIDQYGRDYVAQFNLLG